MLVDARTVPDGARIECDICVAGTGAAELSIAAQFIGSGRKICIAEGGGLKIEPDSQALYEGDNVGLPYFPLDVCRLRQFGGTTNHWAGYCLPFKPEEFWAAALAPAQRLADQPGRRAALHRASDRTGRPAGGGLGSRPLAGDDRRDRLRLRS